MVAAHADKPTVYKIEDMPWELKPQVGMRRTALRTKNSLYIFMEIDPKQAKASGITEAPHNHPFDTMLIVQQGRLILEIDSEQHEMTGGSAIVIPAFAMHRGLPTGESMCSVIEVFSPVRRDYVYLTSHQSELFDDQGILWIKEGGKSWT